MLMHMVEIFAILLFSGFMKLQKAYEAIVIGHQIRYLRRVKDMSQNPWRKKSVCPLAGLAELNAVYFAQSETPFQDCESIAGESQRPVPC
jgi:hypothetical protein